MSAPRVRIPQRLQVIESYLARPNAPHTMLQQIRELGDAAFDHVCARLNDLPPTTADRAEWLLLELADHPCHHRRRWLLEHGCDRLTSDAEWRRVCGARAVWRLGWKFAYAMPLREIAPWSEPIRAAAARGLALGVPTPWDAHVRAPLELIAPARAAAAAWLHAARSPSTDLPDAGIPE